jgi:surface polysaccharide O-acyltransferase-like enzyme
MRDSRLDFLRDVLIVGVICIHTFCVLDLETYPQYRTLSLVLNTICHYAVPLFVMLSGIVLMDKCDEPLSLFYRKRLRRICVPLLPAVLFFTALRIFRDGDAATLVLKETLLGRPYYHLWFAFMLIGVYLFMPFLVRLVREVHNGVLALACCLVVCVASFVGEGPYQILPYCAYATLGMVLARRSRTCRRPIIGWCAFSVAVGLTIWNASNVLRTGSFGTIGYCSPIVMFGSIALLVFVMNCVPLSFGGATATRFATLVLGVYLWHPIFKGIVMAILLRLIPGQMWMVFPVTAIMSFAVLWIISRFCLCGVLLGVGRTKSPYR